MQNNERGGSHMTLSQLSVQYDASAALVAGRLAQLRLALRTTGDQEEARELAEHTAHYYDRGYIRREKYRI